MLGPLVACIVGQAKACGRITGDDVIRPVTRRGLGVKVQVRCFEGLANFTNADDVAADSVEPDDVCNLRRADCNVTGADGVTGNRAVEDERDPITRVLKNDVRAKRIINLYAVNTSLANYAVAGKGSDQCRIDGVDCDCGVL